MSDHVPIKEKTRTLNVAPRFENIGKVIINIDENNKVEAGDERAGRVLEFDNPFGTQELALQILEKLKGYQYQPFEAEDAHVDPAAEIGDAISVRNIYGGIYRSKLTFTSLMTSDVSAPYEEEIDHEFKFESKQERKFKHDIGDLKATMIIQSNEIRAEVAGKLSAEGGTQSFGWRLLADRWAVTSNGQEIFTVDENGGTFTGKIVAASGKIGGFEIDDTKISNYVSGTGIWMSSVPWSDGTVFQIGRNFKVSSDGSITATNGTFNGTLRAKDIQYGGSNGTLNGGAISAGSIGGGSGSALSPAVLGGVNGGINFGSYSGASGGTSPYFRVNYLTASTLYLNSSFVFTGSSITKKVVTVPTTTGNTVLRYLAWG